jgi:L-lysine 2,3-aminomutase
MDWHFADMAKCSDFLAGMPSFIRVTPKWPVFRPCCLTLALTKITRKHSEVINWVNMGNFCYEIFDSLDSLNLLRRTNSFQIPQRVFVAPIPTIQNQINPIWPI